MLEHVSGGGGICCTSTYLPEVYQVETDKNFKKCFFMNYVVL
jgi:hypothetical protein